MKEQEVRVFMLDNDPENCEVEYYWSKEPLPVFSEDFNPVYPKPENLSRNDSELMFSASLQEDLAGQEGIFYLHMKVTDADGNTTFLTTEETQYFQSDYWLITVPGIEGIYLDDKAPAISCTPGATIGSDTPVRITITDNGAGLSDVPQTIDLYHQTQPQF